MTLSNSAVADLLDALRTGDDLVRESVRMVLQELIETEAAEVIVAGRYERSSSRVAERNGTRTKTITTKGGDVQVGIPKLRQGSFFPSILQPRRRIDHALHAVVMEAYVHGVSTRSVDDHLVQALGGTGISKSEVNTTRSIRGPYSVVRAMGGWTMNQSIGWHQFPDGRQLFWNGSQWMAPAPHERPAEPTYLKRKSRTVPGLLMLTAALATAGAGLLPWITIQSADVSIGSAVSIGLHAAAGDQAFTQEFREILFAVAALAFIFAASMLWTKRRVWGPLLRLGYLVPWAISTMMCAYAWSMVASQPTDGAEEDLLNQVFAAADSAARSLGLYQIEAGIGLYLWSGAAVVGLLGMIVPGRMYEERMVRS